MVAFGSNLPFLGIVFMMPAHFDYILVLSDVMFNEVVLFNRFPHSAGPGNRWKGCLEGLPFQAQPFQAQPIQAQPLNLVVGGASSPRCYPPRVGTRLIPEGET